MLTIVPILQMFAKSVFYVCDNSFSPREIFVYGYWFLSVAMSENLRDQTIILKYDARFFNDFSFNDKRRKIKFFIYPEDCFINNETASSILPDLAKGDFCFKFRFVDKNDGISEYDYAFKINSDGTGFLNREIVIEYGLDGKNVSGVDTKFIKYSDSYDLYRIKDLETRVNKSNIDSGVKEKIVSLENQISEMKVKMDYFLTKSN
jgi:hypothetical protein